MRQCENELQKVLQNETAKSSLFLCFKKNCYCLY